MTLREEITKSRNEMYDDVEKASLAEDIELIIERIDKIEERLNSLNFNTGVLISSIDASRELPEPFPGYNEIMKEAIPVLKATIAEKKRELAHKVVPMTESENRIGKIEEHLSDLTTSVLELGHGLRDLDSAKEDKKE